MMSRLDLYLVIFAKSSKVCWHDRESQSVAKLGVIHISRQQKNWVAWVGGWVQKMTSFAEVQCSINADIVGGSEKVQNYADIINGWSLTGLAKCHKPSLRDETAKYIISYTQSPFNVLKATK